MSQVRNLAGTRTDPRAARDRVARYPAQTLLAGLLLVLSACGMQPPLPPVGAQPQTLLVAGHHISVSYWEMRENVAGIAHLGNGSCAIGIDPAYILGVDPSHKARYFLAIVLAHEIGHCIDWLELSFDHNGFKDEGSVYGDYYATPAEGYAETYARTWVKRCGTDLDQHSWKGQTPGKCPVLEPRSVKPPIDDDFDDGLSLEVELRGHQR